MGSVNKSYKIMLKIWKNSNSRKIKIIQFLNYKNITFYEPTI